MLTTINLISEDAMTTRFAHIRYENHNGDIIPRGVGPTLINSYQMVRLQQHGLNVPLLITTVVVLVVISARDV